MILLNETGFIKCVGGIFCGMNFCLHQNCCWSLKLFCLTVSHDTWKIFGFVLWTHLNLYPLYSWVWHYFYFKQVRVPFLSIHVLYVSYDYCSNAYVILIGAAVVNMCTRCICCVLHVLTFINHSSQVGWTTGCIEKA